LQDFTAINIQYFTVQVERLHVFSEKHGIADILKADKVLLE
jgi:hypothetical protein